MFTKILIALFLAATITTIGASPKTAAGNNLNVSSPTTTQTTTTTTPLLPGTSQPIKVGPGNQTNIHVACNLATYTNDDLEGSSTIKYFDFATNSEHTVPGNGLDRLPDTDGQRIVFTELEADGDHVLLYDLASQTTTSIPGNGNLLPSIGGNSVAFMHGTTSVLTGSAEVDVYDRSTGTVTQLTNDTLLNRFPQVSPDGSVVVWEKCQTDGTGCDIYSATQTGPGAFTTRLLTGAGEDHYPDTNGEIVAYISDKGGDNDVYFQRLDGSNEMHLSLPGDQRDVRVSGRLLVFESAVTAYSYEVFVYDMSSARLYQATNTPDMFDSETLSDIVTGCDGLNRIVYARPGAGDYDVYAFTFQLNDSIADEIDDLAALVRSFNLHDGTEASLLSKLQDALAALNASDTATACDSLTAFINASQAQSGKKLTAAQVKQLVDAATQIKSDLGCH